MSSDGTATGKASGNASERAAGHLRGACFVISAASGTGKSTLIQTLYDQRPEVMATMAFSVSHATRPPRPNEVHGEHYYFVDDEAFQALVDEGGFLEYARVHDHWKGTSVREVERLRGLGKDVLLEIDVQGAAQVRRKVPDALTVFILPPSYAELERRLRERAVDSAEAIEQRLRDARDELRQARHFDYVIVNDDVQAAGRALASVFLAGRFRRERMEPAIDAVLASVPSG